MFTLTVVSQAGAAKQAFDTPYRALAALDTVAPSVFDLADMLIELQHNGGCIRQERGLIVTLARSVH